MKLKFKEEYKSVKTFADVEISEMSFFTGKNGSGKTHLLQAIKEEKVTVENFSKKQILYLNYLDFAHNFQTRTDYSQKVSAWNRLNSSGADLVFLLKAQENVIGQNKAEIERVAKQKGKAIFDLSLGDFPVESSVTSVGVVKSYKDNLVVLLSEDNYLGDEIAQSVFDSVISKTEVFLSSLSEYEFKALFQKTAISNRKILSDLSSIFLEYYKSIKRNTLDKAEGKTFLSLEKFKNKNGIPPWDLIRNIFMGFGLSFDVNDPEEENIDPWDGSFQISFKHTEKANKSIPFDDLSSGEKILITLINAIYTANRKNGLPKLILLDEIDGPLNPSIISKFISYLQENFLKNDVKLIVATHSPSTVAFASEDSVYLIDTNLPKPIRSITNKEGIRTLSEGFVTLSDLLEFEQISTSKVVISEGKNYKYLEKSKDTLTTDTDLSILHIRNLGSGQLRTLFDFMRTFNQEKKFIFVWDSDYRINDQGKLKDFTELKAKANPNNQVFIFENNTQGVVTKGVENLINKITCSDYSGTYETDMSAPKNKDKFQKYIVDKTNPKEVLKNFQQLFTFITSATTHHNL